VDIHQQLSVSGCSHFSRNIYVWPIQGKEHVTNCSCSENRGEVAGGQWTFTSKFQFQDAVTFAEYLSRANSGGNAKQMQLISPAQQTKA